MKTTDWLLQLKKDGFLTNGLKNGSEYFHLESPCEIRLTDKASENLRYDNDKNNIMGGVLVAKPKKVKSGNLLTVDDIIFITNVSKSPVDSYSPDCKELNEALKNTLAGQLERTLPIRFHSHSENPTNAPFNYLLHSSSSKQDAIVSEQPILIGNIKLLMPRSIVIKSDKFGSKILVRFYNGITVIK